MRCEQCNYLLLEEDEHFVMCPLCGNTLTQNLKWIDLREYYQKTKYYKKLLLFPFLLLFIWVRVPIHWILKFDDAIYTNFGYQFFFAPCILFSMLFCGLSVQSLESLQKYFEPPIRIFRTYAFMGIKTMMLVITLMIMLQYHTPRIIERISANDTKILFEMMDEKHPIFNENWDGEDSEISQEEWELHLKKIHQEIDKRKPAILKSKRNTYTLFLYINWIFYYCLLWLNFLIYRRGIRINRFLLRNEEDNS